MKLLLAADPMLPVPPTGYGGIERIVDDLVRYYRGAGHQVALIAKAGSTCPAIARFAWPDERIQSSRATVRNACALRRAVRTFQPDLVHSFSRLAYLGAIMRSPLPKIMSYQRHTGGRGVAFMARYSRRLHFTGCSRFICRQGRPAGGDWTAIPNFVDLARYTFVPHVPSDAPLVFLSRLDDIKGPDTAIAIARAAGRRLIIAGNVTPSGPQHDFFQRAIQPLLDRDGIQYIGEVGDAEKNRLLGQAAALLVPIRWDEPFGIVFAEALACGTPVITCGRGALPEIIEPGKTGWFIPEDDIAAGVSAVSRLGELDRTACRQATAERFSLPIVADLYLDLYRRILAGP